MKNNLVEFKRGKQSITSALKVGIKELHTNYIELESSLYELLLSNDIKVLNVLSYIKKFDKTSFLKYKVIYIIIDEKDYEAFMKFKKKLREWFKQNTHWTIKRITSDNISGSYEFKINLTVSNEY